MLDLSRPSPAAHLPGAETDDYLHVRRAIDLIASRRTPLTVDNVAEHLGLSASQLHRLFARWAGSTPEAFLHATTVEQARQLLRDSVGVLDAARDDGRTGPGRPRYLYATHEAITPGRDRLLGLRMSYGFHPSPFGEAIIVATAGGLAGLGFVDDDDRGAALADMQRRWPRAVLTADQAVTASLAARSFDPDQWTRQAPLRVVLIGTPFEQRVWRILLGVPMGRATNYSDIAQRLGKPTAARAVGGAVGRNPISFVVPCHRVLGRSGALTGYHWGLPRKRAMIAWEIGRTAAGA